MCRALQVAIIDDDRDYVKSAAILLRLLGHESHAYHSARDAITALATFVPDVILADLGMPEIDGYRFAKWVRNDPRLAGVVLVAVTGYADERHRAEAIQAGFDDRFVKPLPVEELKAFLAQVGERRSVKHVS